MFAVSVTGWHCSGELGDTVTLPTWGAGFRTLTVCVTGVLSPRPLVDFSVTLCWPTWLKVTLGFCTPVAVDGLPFWKVQLQNVGWPVLRSVNCTVELR